MSDSEQASSLGDGLRARAEEKQWGRFIRLHTVCLLVIKTTEHQLQCTGPVAVQVAVDPEKISLHLNRSSGGCSVATSNAAGACSTAGTADGRVVSAVRARGRCYLSCRIPKYTTPQQEAGDFGCQA